VARSSARIATESPEMTRLMQQLGVGFIVAFALVAIVEDVHRFANPKKLTSYIGLNPTVLKSGESEGPRAISHYGRRDLKTLMVQAAQCVLRKGSDDTAKWAHRKIASGKNRNVVVCALARKLSVRAWHILMGHRSPTGARSAPSVSNSPSSPPPPGVNTSKRLATRSRPTTSRRSALGSTPWKHRRSCKQTRPPALDRAGASIHNSLRTRIMEETTTKTLDSPTYLSEWGPTRLREPPAP